MNFLVSIDSVSYEYLTRIVIALIALLIGYLTVKILIKFTTKILGRLKLDPTLLAFIKSSVGICYYTIMFILVLTIAGVPSTYFAGMLVGLGTAIGFGLRDEFKTVSNGIIILITKPFKLGDIVQLGNYTGTVIDIRLFQTVLKTFDNLHVIINNGSISTKEIVKLSDNDTRRQDIIIGVSYDDDITKVKQVLEKLVSENPFILKEPQPLIAMNEFAESSINFLIRFWSKRTEILNAKFSMNENIKLAFDKENISIPYPHHNIILHNSKD